MRFLSQCIGLPVRDPSGEPIGTIADLIVAIGDRYPPVTGLVARTDRRQIFLPWLSVLSLGDDGARLARADHRHHQVQPAAARDPAQGRPAGQADRGHRGAQGHPRQRRAPRRDRWPAAGRGGRRRGGRARPAAGHGGPVPDGRPRAAPRRPRAVHRLGGRRSARQHDREHPAARPARAAWPSSTRRTSPTSSTSSRRATASACSPRSTTRPSRTWSRRWSPTRRSRCSRTSSRPAQPTSSRR